MKETGTWIKLFRSIQDNWIWNDTPFSKGQAWVDLIMLAQSQDGKFLDSRGNLIDGERGTVYRSENWLAARWGWSRHKTDQFLKQLESDGMIIWYKKRASTRTRIKLVNYSIYQDSSTSKRTSQGQVADKSRTSQGQVADINNELQNDMNDIIPDIKESVREKTPPVDSIQLFEDLRTEFKLSDRVTESLRLWVRYKSERRESYKEQGMRSLLSQTSKHAAESGDEAVCNLIEMCMSNGWKGIIWDKLKDSKSGTSKSSQPKTRFDNFPQRENDYSAYINEKIRKRYNKKEESE